MSVNPRIYSKCLSAEENRSFSYLISNENAILCCAVTNKGKVLTLERLGAAYCLKLYCLTTNSQKWERILEKDMKVLQYSNINIFVINNEKHAFELADRDESIKLYEKIRGCIKKLNSSTSSNPSNQVTVVSKPKQKPARPPPTYRTSINRALQSNVLSVTPQNIVNDLIDITPETNNENSSVSTIVTASKSPIPSPRRPENINIRPEDSNKSAVASVAVNLATSSSNIATSSTVFVQNRLPPNLMSNTTVISSNRSPIMSTRPPVQDIGIPIVPTSSKTNTISTTTQQQFNARLMTALTQQSSTENLLEEGNYSVGSPNLSIPRATNNVSAIGSSSSNNIMSVSHPNPILATGYESGNTSNVIATVINNRNQNLSGASHLVTNSSVSRIVTSNLTSNTSSANNDSVSTSSSVSLSNSICTSTVSQTVTPISTVPSSINSTSAIIYPTNTVTTTVGATRNFCNRNIHFTNSTNLLDGPRVQTTGERSLQTFTSGQSGSRPVPTNQNGPASGPGGLRSVISNQNGLAVGPGGTRPAERVPINGQGGPTSVQNRTPIVAPRRRAKTVNSVERQKARSAFIQPASMVSEMIGQFTSRLFMKDEEKPTIKCVKIGNPTNVTHQIHLDSFDFKNLQGNQFKGLIKSKSFENLSKADKLTVYHNEEEGPMCVICLSDPPSHVLVPCGHKIICEACVQQKVLSRLKRKRCMTCNTEIREIIKVFE